MDRYNLELALGFIESHLDAAARELEMHPPGAVAALMLAIPLAQAQRLITRILPIYAARIVAALAAQESAAMLAGGNAHQVAAILRQLPTGTRDPILPHFPERLARTCRAILRHPEDTVGAWMSTDALTLPPDISAKEALQRVARATELGDGNAVPLLDESRKLLGYTGVGDLLRARRDTPISRLRRELEPATLPSKMSLRAAEQHIGWQQRDSLVVINQLGQVEGLLRHATLRKGLRVAHGEHAATDTESIVSELGHTYASTLTTLFALASGESRSPGSAAASGRGAKS